MREASVSKFQSVFFGIASELGNEYMIEKSNNEYKLEDRNNNDERKIKEVGIVARFLKIRRV